MRNQNLKYANYLETFVSFKLTRQLRQIIININHDKDNLRISI